MKQKLLILLVLFNLSVSAQNWKSYKVNEKGNIKAAMVIGNLNDTIYVSGNDGKSHYNSFIYSKDKGATWSEPKGILTEDYGAIAQYVGVKDRIYASLKLPFKDYLYYHSKDNGTTWVLDTIGLPHYYGMKSRHKDAFTLKKLGNDYIVAYNQLTVNSAYYKKIDDNSWKPLSTSTSKVNYGFASLNNSWFSLNPKYLAASDEYITKSTDNGVTWQPIKTSGLPSTFSASILASNKKNRLFLGGSLSSATNKTAVFYSDDEGKTWQNTNAETLVPYTNYIYIVDIFSFDNKVVVTYNTGFNTPALYLYSDQQIPNFEFGDTSGLPNNTFAVPNVVFNIDETFYLNHYNDLYSKENIALSVDEFTKSTSINTYPNPIENQLTIKSDKDFTWKLVNLQGKTILSGDYQKKQLSKTIHLDFIARGTYIFFTSNGYRKKIIKK